MLACAGCKTHWADHYHSDPNQQLAQSAFDDLKRFTGSSAGFGPALLTNLDAQFGLVQQADTTRLKLQDNLFATSLADETWNALRGDIFRRWGCPVTSTDDLDARLDATQKVVTAAIVLRIQKVQAIGKVLEALTEGQRALIAEAAMRITNATALMTNASTTSGQPSSSSRSATTAGSTNAVTTTSISPSLAGLLLQFENAVVDSGRQYRTNQLLRGDATVLEKEILNEAEASRDPASAYALAAVLGTGLDESSFSNLDSFLAYLSQRLLALQQSQTNQPANPFWQEFATSLTNAQRLVWATQLQYELPAGPELELRLGTNQAFQALSREGLRVQDVVALFGASNNQLAAIATNLIQSTKKAGDELAQLEVGVAGLKNVLNNTELIQLIAQPLNPSVLASIFLTNALSLNTNVTALLQNQKIIKPADLQQIGSILQRIASENQAAALRLLTFFADLASVQLSLYQEDLRHFQALSYVGSRELKRWQTLQKLNTRNAAQYSTSVSRAGANAIPAALFGFDHAGWRAAYTNTWAAYYTNYGQSPPPPALKPDLIPPVIQPNSRILPSIRLLAENARSWQQISPSQTDPDGLVTTASNARLWHGVKLVQAYFLMFALDGQYASENSRFLRKEIMEHELQVDGVIDLVDEADFRLRLGDILAFHSTGITDADIQTGMSIIQSAFVGWIGAKQ